MFSPSFSVFRQIPSIASSSDNSSFYGYCNGQFNKNNRKLLNMSRVLIILATTVVCIHFFPVQLSHATFTWGGGLIEPILYDYIVIQIINKQTSIHINIIVI